MTNDDQKTEEELEDIEEKLKRVHEESKKPEMGVSGRSVFEIKRIKDESKN